MSGSTAVLGGAYSIAAESDDLATLARRLEQASFDLADSAAAAARAAADPLLASTALLDPVGAFEVAERAALTCALAAETVAGLLALSACLEAAVAAYRRADSLRADYAPLVRGVAAAPVALADLFAAPADLATGHAERLQRVLTDDPYLADWALAGLRASPVGVVAGSAVASISASLGSLYRDGTPVLTRITGPAVDDTSGPPRSLTDLIRGVAVRDGAEDGGQSGGGMIDIKFVAHSQGDSRSVIVDLPGTTRWNLNPFTTTSQVSDFGTNLRALGGRSTVYERGVIEALVAAGVRPGEPIMLVGHSEGGLVASQLANDLADDDRFTVTHVVTAGAPLGVARLPSAVSTLSLENRHDLVPQLDGRDNPSGRNRMTATFDRGGDTVVAKHAVTTYLEGAADVDACKDPSVAAWKNDASGFFDGTSIRTEVFQIRRA